MQPWVGLSRRLHDISSKMPSKIFISYRRQDSGANVLGIGQYLEIEFGRKNVFVDVDMRAGTNFRRCWSNGWQNAKSC